MKKTVEALRAALKALRAVDARFAVVGGFAVAVRAEPRFTRDVDFALAVEDDAQAEQVVKALRAKGFELAAVLEQTARGRLSTVRLLAPGTGRGRVVVDLLFASSGIESEVVGSAEQLRLVPGLDAPVARTGHLIAMKLLSRDDRRRPQDIIDLRALAAGAERAELARARKAVRTIERRGFNRRRNLEKALGDLLADRARHGGPSRAKKPGRRRPGKA